MTELTHARCDFLVTTPDSNINDLQSSPGIVPGGRERDERSFAQEVLQLQLAEIDLPEHLRETFNWQLQDSIQRARMMIVSAQEAVYQQAGMNSQERSGLQATAQLVDILGLPATATQLDVDRAIQSKLFRDLGIPKHLSWNDGFVYLQQKVFKKNLALMPDADKATQIRQLEVVASFGR